ncbi:MAG: hypothetical protein ACLPYS_15645 [Vulcanimicrobiaceae bacterium]
MSATTEPRTTLRVFAEDRPQAPLREVADHAEIIDELAAIGVRFQRFEAASELP